MCRTMPLNISATSMSALSSAGITLPLGRFCRWSLVTCSTCCGSLLMVRQGRALIVCPCTEPRVASTSAGHCHWLSGLAARKRRSSSSSSRLSEYAAIAIVRRVRIVASISPLSRSDLVPPDETAPASLMPVS
jgi:hypothetical protein